MILEFVHYAGHALCYSRYKNATFPPTTFNPNWENHQLVGPPISPTQHAVWKFLPFQLDPAYCRAWQGYQHKGHCLPNSRHTVECCRFQYSREVLLICCSASKSNLPYGQVRGKWIHCNRIVHRIVQCTSRWSWVKQNLKRFNRAHNLDRTQLRCLPTVQKQKIRQYSNRGSSS